MGLRGVEGAQCAPSLWGGSKHMGTPPPPVFLLLGIISGAQACGFLWGSLVIIWGSHVPALGKPKAWGLWTGKGPRGSQGEPMGAGGIHPSLHPHSQLIPSPAESGNAALLPRNKPAGSNLLLRPLGFGDRGVPPARYSMNRELVATITSFYPPAASLHGHKADLRTQNGLFSPKITTERPKARSCCPGWGDPTCPGVRSWIDALSPSSLQPSPAMEELPHALEVRAGMETMLWLC